MLNGLSGESPRHNFRISRRILLAFKDMQSLECAYSRMRQCCWVAFAGAAMVVLIVVIHSSDGLRGMLRILEPLSG